MQNTDSSDNGGRAYIPANRILRKAAKAAKQLQAQIQQQERAAQEQAALQLRFDELEAANVNFANTDAQCRTQIHRMTAVAPTSRLTGLRGRLRRQLNSCRYRYSNRRKQHRTKKIIRNQTKNLKKNTIAHASASRCSKIYSKIETFNQTPKSWACCG